MPHLSVFATREALMQAASDRLVRALERGMKARGYACAALSGGGTPEPAYALLAQAKLDWRKVTFALVDERFVHPKDDASNEKMLRRALAPALDAGATLLPMFSTDGSPAEVAARADAMYAPLHIDVALMGMGGDAHAASWFPGHAREAFESTRTIIAVHAPQAAGKPDRITLTKRAIARADEVLLLIHGEDKRARLDAALAEPPEAAPVAALFDDPEKQPEVLWTA
ncbi:6-phosphogluconolactonase [Vitreimonas flagellata]|uniref:6-phosphogluconolactonase n=1 Tax=Vitreimonas flagellata TaxID=2560861 RepID=UPI001074D98B|nr:6-phosphogluconolactonase [Vitreimonas flagellata]